MTEHTRLHPEMPGDAAIAQAVAATEQTVQMAQLQLALPSGRPMILALPRDVTLTEVLGGMQAYLIAAQQILNMQPQSRIVLPPGVAAPPPEPTA